MTRPGFIALLRRAYERWTADYTAFAKMRGFTTLNDWPYHRRGFIECWGEPGFHRFWRVWNPGVAYFVYRAYVALGGRRHQAAATMLSFIACGLAHTVIAAPFAGRWSYTLIVAFAAWGAVTIGSRRLAPFLRQERWPTVVNVALNVALVIGGFDLGFRVDRLL